MSKVWAFVRLGVVSSFPCFVIGVQCQARSKPQAVVSPISVFSEARTLSAAFPPDDRAVVLYQVAAAAESFDHRACKAWSLELFRVAKDQMGSNNRQAMQKNALVVLSAVDPKLAADMFKQQDLPDFKEGEDYRVWAAGPLFSSLWRREQQKSLHTIKSLSIWMGDTGEYPYAAIAEVMLELSKTGHGALVNDLFADGEYAYETSSRRFLGASQDYVDFLLRVHSIVDRALLSGSLRNLVSQLEDTILPDKPKIQVRVDNRSGTHSFNSIEDGLIYRLLPLIKDTDPELAESILRRNRAISSEPLPAINENNTWRAVALQDTQLGQAEVNGAFQKQSLQGALDIAAQDPNQGMLLARRIDDPEMRDIAMASIMPQYLATESNVSGSELTDIERRFAKMRPDEHKLKLEVALIRTYFALHRYADAQALVNRAFDLGTELVSEDMLAHPGRNTYPANGAEDLFSLANYLGEHAPDPAAAWGLIESVHDDILKGELLAAFGRGLVLRRSN